MSKQVSKKKDPDDWTVQVQAIHQLRSRRNPFVMRNSQFSDWDEALCFLEQMNRNAVRLDLRSTFLDSVHGLCNINSKTTALDIAKLCSVCMRNAEFRKIVGT